MSITSTTQLIAFVPPLSRKALWLLYCLAGFSYREMSEELAGWRYQDIKTGIDRWRLVWTGPLYLVAKMFMRYHLAERCGQSALDQQTGELLNSGRQHLQAWIREQAQQGRDGWDRINALPGPDEVEAWVRAWEEGR